MEIELIVLVGSLALIVYFFTSSKERKELKSFKGPSPLPLLGNAPELISRGKERELVHGRRFELTL